MEEVIQNRIIDSITDGDLRAYFGNDVNKHIIKYSEFQNYNKINQILKYNKDYKIVLIENTTNNGHWILIMRYNNTIEIFNSYGLKPSEDLKYMNNNYYLGQDEKYLNNILDNSMNEFKIIFNTYRFQKMEEGINTCGRWLILRYIMLRDYNMDLYKFIEFFKKLKKEYKNKPNDYIIASIII